MILGDRSLEGNLYKMPKVPEKDREEKIISVSFWHNFILWENHCFPLNCMYVMFHITNYEEYTEDSISIDILLSFSHKQEKALPDDAK